MSLTLDDIREYLTMKKYYDSNLLTNYKCNDTNINSNNTVTVEKPVTTNGLEENLGYLYGPWIGIDIPVESVSTLSDGSDVYVAKQEKYVKMVTSTGEAKYYIGDISSFNVNEWNSYYDAKNNYIYKPPSIETITQTPIQTTSMDADSFLRGEYAQNEASLAILNSSFEMKNNFLSLYNDQYDQNMQLFIGILLISGVLAKMMFYPIKPI